MSHSKSRVTQAGQRLRAHRLGEAPLGRVRYVAERAIVEDFRARHGPALKRVAANLRYFVRTSAAGESWEVGQRLKAMPTILDKLVREPGMELSRMHDIGGCRGILSSQEAVDDVIERLQSQRRWRLRNRVWDYVSEPKDDGYRAKHLVAIKDDVLIEIQLRTITQHRWAELVERFDRTHRLNLKAGRANAQMRDLFVEISRLLRLQEQGDLSDVEFMTRMSALGYAEGREPR